MDVEERILRYVTKTKEMLNYISQAISQYFPTEVFVMMECLIPAVSSAVVIGHSVPTERTELVQLKN